MTLLWWAALAIAGGGRPDRAEDLAVRSLDEPDPTRALKLAMRAVKVDAECPQAHFAQAMAWLRASHALGGEGRPAVELAKEELRATVALAPDSRIGKVAHEALAGLEGGVAIDPVEPACPASAAAAADEAETRLARGDRPGARAAWERALEGCPDNPAFWAGASVAWADEPDRALAHAEQAIALDPCQWEGLRSRAEVLDRRGELEPAWDALVQAVSCNPGDAKGWSRGVDLTARLGGEVRHPGPIRAPRTPQQAVEAGPAWDAWWWHRATKGAEDLDGAVAAVRAGLDAAPPEGVWQVLAEAEAEGTLDVAVLVLLFEPALADDLRELHARRPTAVVDWLRAHVFVR